jgi:release factor glutamine methyltransferase
MVLRSGTKLLTAAIGEGAIRDARILMAHTLNVPTDRLTFELSRMVTPTQVAQFEHAIHRRAAHTPISHITGKRAFWNHEFRVTPDVLDPRPDTETLIELALNGPKPKTILDLGTGSGCILVSLLAELPEAKGVGTDISDAALAIATETATNAGVEVRAQFQNSDWFETVTGKFDLIVSNPPYITAAEMDDLSPDVREHEPHIALTPGGDGLAAYRRIARDLPEYLAPNGRAFFEMGKDQGADVREIFTATGIGQVTIHQDLNGHERIIAVKT